MSNVYFGSYLAGATGNWNTVGNWYSNPGSPAGSCCCGVPGTPLGRVPNPATDSVILFNSTTGGATPGVITTGPAGGYSGPITWSTVNNLGKWEIGAGDYSGTVTINDAGGTGPITPFGITGGNFSGNVILNGLSLGPIPSNVAQISGGVFTGIVTRAQYPFVNKITGGTYSPSAETTQTDGLVNPAGVPADVGFFDGGVFSPQITITNLPDILGAGLPA